MTQTIGSAFLNTTISRMKSYRDLAEKAMAQVNDQDLDKIPYEDGNSIAIIVKHMAGNMLSRWTNFLTEDGEKPWRQRDEEFEQPGLSREELLKLWANGWSCYLDAMAGLQEEDLLKTITIRQESLLVIDAMQRQVGHYSYHIGQIITLARFFKGKAWTSLSIPRGGTHV